MTIPVSSRLESVLQTDLRGLVNFIMLSQADVVMVDGARAEGGKNAGRLSAKSEVLDQLVHALPDAVRYEAARQHQDVHETTGAILGPKHGLDVGQARLGALDFLEQVPVDQLVMFDRSPLSSLMFEPNDPVSEAEVCGWLHRVHHGNTRQILVIALHEEATGVVALEQKSLLNSVDKYILKEGQPGPRMHVFVATVRPAFRGAATMAVTAAWLTPDWNYR